GGRGRAEARAGWPDRRKPENLKTWKSEELAGVRGRIALAGFQDFRFSPFQPRRPGPGPRSRRRPLAKLAIRGNEKNLDSYK
ncbi:MAG TPA: hypothetical protein PLR37_16780, partial [Candidatus Accumulibacter phosphatis]|nr:hypothetical protein [Candidatus Accumulibacter phosphatis]